MTDGLVKQGNGDLVLPSSLEMVDFSEDFVMPRFGIAQGTSEITKNRDSDVRVGDIYNNVTGEVIVPEGEPLDVVLLDFIRIRHHWGFSMNDTPKCRSSDSRFGEPLTDEDTFLNRLVFEHGRPVCKVCPYAQWDRQERGSKAKPTCRLLYTFPCVLRDDISYSGLGTLTLMSFNEKIAKNIISTALLRKQELYVRSHRFSTVGKQTDKGDFHVFTHSRGSELNDEEAEQIGVLVAQIKSISAAAREAAESAAAEDREEQAATSGDTGSFDSEDIS